MERTHEDQLNRQVLTAYMDGHLSDSEIVTVERSLIPETAKALDLPIALVRTRLALAKQHPSDLADAPPTTH